MSRLLLLHYHITPKSGHHAPVICTGRKKIKQKNISLYSLFFLPFPSPLPTERGEESLGGEAKGKGRKNKCFGDAGFQFDLNQFMLLSLKSHATRRERSRRRGREKREAREVEEEQEKAERRGRGESKKGGHQE
jgi:hypothetical protein